MKLERKAGPRSMCPASCIKEITHSGCWERTDGRGREISRETGPQKKF